MKEQLLINLQQLQIQINLLPEYIEKEENLTLMSLFELLGEKCFKINLQIKDYIKKENNL